MNEWISVNKRLPKKSMKVILLGSDGIPISGSYQGNSFAGEFKWRLDNSTRKSLYSGIDYWMPLPEPPKDLNET